MHSRWVERHMKGLRKRKKMEENEGCLVLNLLPMLDGEEMGLLATEGLLKASSFGLSGFCFFPLTLWILQLIWSSWFENEARFHTIIYINIVESLTVTKIF
ncbi:hypothetical protein L1049_028241 [Liquidambar formosana]|uniref:Uncharacterized protein n=1 Tax=Liquidambar formosana TaxID=63359 RepID=A0AAP0RIN3_LIQFO